MKLVVNGGYQIVSVPAWRVIWGLSVTLFSPDDKRRKSAISFGFVMLRNLVFGLFQSFKLTQADIALLRQVSEARGPADSLSYITSHRIPRSAPGGWPGLVTENVVAGETYLDQQSMKRVGDLASRMLVTRAGFGDAGAGGHDVYGYVISNRGLMVLGYRDFIDRFPKWPSTGLKTSMGIINVILKLYALYRLLKEGWGLFQAKVRRAIGKRDSRKRKAYTPRMRALE